MHEFVSLLRGEVDLLLVLVDQHEGGGIDEQSDPEVLWSETRPVKKFEQLFSNS